MYFLFLKSVFLAYFYILGGGAQFLSLTPKTRRISHIFGRWSSISEFVAQNAKHFPYFWAVELNFRVCRPKREEFPIFLGGEAQFPSRTPKNRSNFQDSSKIEREIVAYMYIGTCYTQPQFLQPIVSCF